MFKYILDASSLHKHISADSTPSPGWMPSDGITRLTTDQGLAQPPGKTVSAGVESGVIGIL